MKKIIWMILLGFVSFLYAETVTDAQGVGSFWMWMALGLGLIAIIIIYLSSKQMMKMQKLHKEMFDKQLDIEHSQSLFLSSMSEKIHDMVEQTYTGTVEKSNNALVTGKNRQNSRLLDITHDLIEFLRLKSKKVEIVKGQFNLNNVLNEVSGAVCSSFKGSNVELIVDVDNNIPRYLVGDSLNLEKVLNNLLEYTMNQLDEGEVTLEIAMFGNYEEEIELQFKLLDTGLGLNLEEMDKLFIPYYDEKSNEYTGLGLYVAKELISVMNGELAVQSTEGKGTTFTLSLPFELEDPSNRRNYRLPEKVLTTKKVFIVDSNYNSALAIKKMFSYFRHDVKVVSKEEFVKNMYNLSVYDIVILDETLFNIRTVDYLKRIKEEKDFKVIVLNSLLRKDENSSLNPVVDRSLAKPLNQERVFELIIDMYNINVEHIAEDVEAVTPQGIEIHRASIVDTPQVTRESFSDFGGMKLLIVEDNIINQKVLTNILNLSDIQITIAHDGREAVDIVTEKKKKFDFVLMDINMPIMDGYSATEMIRTQNEFDGLPIVAFTALALDSEKQKIFNSGMNAYLTKPLELGKLYTVFKMFYADINGNKRAVSKKETKIIEQTDVLDIQVGIKYANSNEAFYMEILKEFMDAYGESSELFAKLVREHRYEQVKMLCLDMKGLTGTIGARDMYDLINQINQCVIYNKQELLGNYTDSYKSELNKLHKFIKHYISA